MGYRFRGALIAALLCLTGAARADMGPSCGCKVGRDARLGNATLAVTFGLLGVGALIIERQRHKRR